jgi:hypothetical protein
VERPPSLKRAAAASVALATISGLDPSRFRKLIVRVIL